MVINFDIVCITGTVQGQAKKNNVSIPWKTGKSTIVTHGTIRVKETLGTCGKYAFGSRQKKFSLTTYLPQKKY